MDTGLDVDKINKTAPPVEEHSDEEQRQVSGLYEAMWKLFDGVDHVVVAKACGVFMVTLMHVSEKWGHIIPGFMNQMTMGANLALNHHKPKGNDNGEEGGGTEEAQGDDRGVEVKEG
jgi:hypothetical protein